MYSPKYTISNPILKNISTIEACREVIDNAPLIPSYERRFREDARVRTVHHGTHVEGNDLTFEQAERILDRAGPATDAGEVIEKTGVAAHERDVQEVINYRRVVDWLDEQFGKYRSTSARQVAEGGQLQFHYTEAQVKQIHKLTVHRIVAAESEGAYRKTQVVLRDSRTGEITFRPPPAVEVPYLMEDFISWLNSSPGRDVHSVLRAGIAHYGLAAVHPFVEGNGRTARAFATLILFVEGYDIKRLFSLEQYFDSDAAGYYKTLISTSDQSRELTERDLTSWLEYFTLGLSIELARVLSRVRKLSIDSRIKLKRGEQIMLTDRQIKIVEYLSENGQATMADLRDILSRFSDDTILREVQSLLRKGIISKKGRTRGVVYKLAT